MMGICFGISYTKGGDSLGNISVIPFKALLNVYLSIDLIWKKKKKTRWCRVVTLQAECPGSETGLGLPRGRGILSVH